MNKASSTNRMRGNRMRGIGISGLSIAHPTTILGLGQLFKRVGGGANAFSLRGQNTYRDLAWTDWGQIKSEALMNLARYADRNTDSDKQNTVFAHSLGAIAGLMAAVKYTQADSELDENTAMQIDDQLGGGEIETFLGYNPPAVLTPMMKILMGVAILILLLFGNWPIIGPLVKLIPFYKIKESDFKASTEDRIVVSWLPLVLSGRSGKQCEI